MYRSKLFIVILVAIGCFHVGAQSPGYMGKKAVIGYGFYFNPAFAAVSIGYGDHPINTLHEIFLEYASGKKFMLCGSVRLYKSTYNNTGMVNTQGSRISSSYNQLDDHPSGYYEISGRNFLFYGKFFKSNYLAPWGRYFCLGFTINTFETTYQTGQMRVLVEEQNYPTNKRYYFSDFGPTTQSFQTVDMFFGNGKSRIFANKLVLDYGYNINVVAASLVLLDAFDDEENYANEYIENTATARIRGINRFNFYVKLGYLF